MESPSGGGEGKMIVYRIYETTGGWVLADSIGVLYIRPTVQEIIALLPKCYRAAAEGRCY